MNIRNHNKILILTGSFGDGHRKVAEAISESFGFCSPGADIEVMDVIKRINPNIHLIIHFIFMLMVKKLPFVYGVLYNATRDSHVAAFLPKIFLKIIGLPKIQNVIGDVQPSVVISTCPLSATIVAYLKARNMLTVPTYTVITDHTDHGYWLSPQTDYYIVGSDYVKQSLIEMGVPESRIMVTGIPIRAEFSQRYNKKLVLSKYGVDSSLPTVMVMGGGEGMIGGLARVLKGNSLPVKLNVLIVCGHNDKLRKKLDKELRRSIHHVNVMGYVDHIAEIMAISDLIITKPGGVTTSEAIAAHLPMLLYKPIPGQEVDNAEFLVRSGVALQAHNRKDLLDLLQKAVGNPEELSHMKRNAKKFEYKWCPYALHLHSPRMFTKANS
ncbi:glycosyltransferase [Aneurinibacillus sp. Ricciae_BoGa-3]|uniref:MGDG synthase family glycosyltransferase n=1 Tax=Aneurinibacillus sp. Ricciae_BoGa-3 TaxID=3022697 RepID=UPI00233FD72B|nr:glycosyltransferase [Aneurinibacillus sp. Ricciae_BoGa-3]WCK56462.1 glycosyltransferase [Aneurinibacillus sp. Ricciae_BoGa-3]